MKNDDDYCLFGLFQYLLGISLLHFRRAVKFGIIMIQGPCFFPLCISMCPLTYTLCHLTMMITENTKLSKAMQSQWNWAVDVFVSEIAL